jgi:predicted transcriptional regulator
MLLTIEEIRRALEDRNLWVVAGRTGVSYSTLYRVRKGAAVSYKHLTALSEYFRGEKVCG